ncbi:MAG: hypothetical protein ABI351_12070 [Herbaspirillum sp.]
MNKYIPSLAKLSQETIATGFAVIVIAFIVAKSPQLRALVRNYDLNPAQP